MKCLLCYIFYIAIACSQSASFVDKPESLWKLWKIYTEILRAVTYKCMYVLLYNFILLLGTYLGKLYNTQVNSRASMYLFLTFIFGRLTFLPLCKKKYKINKRADYATLFSWTTFNFFFFICTITIHAILLFHT